LHCREAINRVNALALGKFINERRWQGVAELLFHQVSSKNRIDLVPSMSECSGLLNWFDRIMLHFSGKLENVSLDKGEWWLALHNTASELYPRGPTDQDLWDRAGGDNSSLQSWGAGREIWTSALNLLQHGGGGKQITPSKLLAEMRKNYPNNSNLSLLDEYRRKLHL
jgi:hypothetical protein